MDFFEAQAHARKRTTRLVVLFGLAVAGTILASYVAAIVIFQQFSPRVRNLEHGYWQYQRTASWPDETASYPWWNPQIFAGVALGTLAVVGLASLYKWSQFRGGGSVVAEGVGGRRIEAHTTDLRERRLLNVVEEMAIAAGVPIPAVYVLDDEAGLNAFAAGLTTSDAVVAVTRGTMEKLSRDELQGVIAHEFSHILNGDMRLNVKLAAIVFGILVIGLVGRGILRGLGGGRVRVRGKGGGGAIVAILAIGLALLIIGYIGYFFGHLIQAAVSRQREFLADASAVQFTRNPSGILGALRKIGGYALGSHLETHKAAEIGHFFFAEGFPALFLGGLWATHPPLDARIRAIDPQWDGTFFQPAETVDVAHESFVQAGLVPPKAGLPSGAAQAIALTPAAVMAAVGTLNPEHVDYARALLDRMPAPLLAAARNGREAPAVIYGLLMERGGAIDEPQAAILAARAGEGTVRWVRELLPQFARLGVDARLPLAQLALPALRQLAPPEVSAFTGTCQALIAADRQLSYFEFALQKVLLRHLAVRGAPSAKVVQLYSFNAVVNEIAVLLSALAWAGAMQGPEQADGTVEADRAAAAAAFGDGASQLPLIRASLALLDPDGCAFAQIDAALDRLAGASFPIKQRLLLAGAHTVSHDNQIRAEEGELLRAFADSLGCPMPPLLGGL
ncbi:MAG TPA: M48 family metallopeptidase [Opitutaceae bacterium]|nr:M48 family metallopeptidase [Opitutaceae bacterium]